MISFRDQYRFMLEFCVRDYECDLQGIVNNSVYLNYLEHTRHQFLKTQRIDFAQLAEEDVHLVVIRIEIDYRVPLRSADCFVVGLNLERVTPLRLAFLQDIYRVPDLTQCIAARVVGTGITRDGRLVGRERLKRLMDEVE